MHKRTHNRPYRFLSAVLSLILTISFAVPITPARAQSVMSLPLPGVMVPPSQGFIPAVIKGIKVFPENPLRFDFIIDTGNTALKGDELTSESSKLIKYFLASLTIPEDDVWVNLSPYEKDRIIPDQFGQTEMGRDLLAQDYILKQLTASLIYPEDELGKKFWKKIYAKANMLYGTTEIPINTFNKVWVVPEKAVVHQSGDIAFVMESHLKVMLEEDYLQKTAHSNQKRDDKWLSPDVSQLSSEMIRDVILPEIEKEVNEGENFAPLRQVYYSMILATWFKRNLKQSLLNKVYIGENKVAGVDVTDKNIKEKIYQQYLQAFKAGVYNYIKEDYDQYSQQSIPRKYFSGGVTGLKLNSDAFIIEDKGSGDNGRATVLANATEERVGIYHTASAVLDPQRSNGDGNPGDAGTPPDFKRVEVGGDETMLSQPTTAAAKFTKKSKARPRKVAKPLSLTGQVYIADKERNRALRPTLNGSGLAPFRENFGPGERALDLAEMVSPGVQGFAKSYINQYYSDRVYRGNYFKDRIDALATVRVAPAIPSRKVAQAAARLRGKQESVRESIAWDQEELENAIDFYSPVLSWHQTTPSTTPIYSELKGGDGRKFDVVTDQHGDRHYGYGGSGSIYNLLEPFFNIPRRSRTREWTGEQQRTRFLTDSDFRLNIDLIDEADLDIVDMLPLDDPVQSMISSALVKIFFQDFEKPVTPVGSARYSDNQIVRKDGSTYIFDFDTNTYNVRHLMLDSQNRYTNNARENVQNILQTISSLSIEERTSAIRYFVETLFFYPYILSLKYPDSATRLDSDEASNYPQMLVFPYYVHKILNGLDGQEANRELVNEFNQTFLDMNKMHEPFIQTELDASTRYDPLALSMLQEYAAELNGGDSAGDAGSAGDVEEIASAIRSELSFIRNADGDEKNEGIDRLNDLIRKVDALTQESYARVAGGEYDRLKGKRTVPQGRDLQEIQRFHHLLGEATTSEQKTVIDLGGHSRDARWFAGQGVKPIVIDSSNEVIHSVQETNSEWDARVMDMRDLKFANESVDGVWAQASLHHLVDSDPEDPLSVDRAVQEASRVLKKGGVFHVLVKDEFQGRHGFVPIDTGEGFGPRFYQHYSEATLKDLLERNGFELIGNIGRFKDARGERNLIVNARKKEIEQSLDPTGDSGKAVGGDAGDSGAATKKRIDFMGNFHITLHEHAQEIERAIDEADVIIFEHPEKIKNFLEQIWSQQHSKQTVIDNIERVAAGTQYPLAFKAETMAVYQSGQKTHEKAAQAGQPVEPKEFFGSIIATDELDQKIAMANAGYRTELLYGDVMSAKQHFVHYINNLWERARILDERLIQRIKEIRRDHPDKNILIIRGAAHSALYIALKRDEELTDNVIERKLLNKKEGSRSVFFPLNVALGRDFELQRMGLTKLRPLHELSDPGRSALDVKVLQALVSELISDAIYGIQFQFDTYWDPDDELVNRIARRVKKDEDLAGLIKHFESYDMEGEGTGPGVLQWLQEESAKSEDETSVETGLLSVEELARLGLDSYVQEVGGEAGKAMDGDGDSGKAVGGIDFNPGMLEIQTEGQDVNLDILFDPQTIQDIQSAPIDGFAPVIFQIVPTNLQMLFGAGDKEELETQRLSRADLS